MAQLYSYRGQQYQLPDGLSNDEALAKIEDYLSGLEDDDLLDPDPIDEPDPIEEPDPSETYEGVAQEFIEGIGSGIIGIGEGILETAALGVDLIADSDLATSVRQGAQELRDSLGIDPEGFAGKGTEALVQFGVPGIAAIGAVSKFSRLGKQARNFAEQRKAALLQADEVTQNKLLKDAAEGALTGGQKAALGAQQIAAMGLTDAVVATNNLTTFGDFFEGGPTQTDQTEGLTGRDEAFRRIQNKAKFGLESLALGGAIGGTFATAGRALDTKTGQVITRGAAKGVTYPFRKTGEALQRLDEKIVLNPESVGLLGRGVAGTAAALRPRGMLPQDVAAVKTLLGSEVEGAVGATGRKLQRLTKLSRQLAKELAKKGNNQSDLTAEKIRETALEFILAPKKVMIQTAKGAREANLATLSKRRGEIVYTGVNKDLKEKLDQFATPEMKELLYKIRRDIDDLSLDVGTGPTAKRVSGKTKDELREMGLLGIRDFDKILRQELGSYTRRSYRIFEEEGFKASDEAIAAAVSGYKKSNAARNAQIKKILDPKPRDFVGDPAGLAAAREFVGNLDRKTFESLQRSLNKKTATEADINLAAEFAKDSFINRWNRKINKQAMDRKEAGRTPVDRLNLNILKRRTKIQDFERALLGEIKDPDESILKTVAELAEFRAADRYFASLKSMADNPNNALGKYFVAPGQTTSATNLKELSGDFGALKGYLVPERIYNDLTRKVVGKEDGLTGLVQSAYYGALRLKGFSQYSKTVLSPITQVRNVTTASAFALAQGNIGSGANLFDSMGLVYRQIMKNGDEGVDDALKEAVELGVINNQAQLKESLELLKGTYGRPGATSTNSFGELGQDYGESGLTMFFKNSLQKTGVGRAAKGAQDLYQGGDDLWKLYNFQFEQNKILNVLQKSGNTVDEQVEALAQLRQMRLRDVDPTVIRNQIKSEGLTQSIKKEAAEVVRNTVPNYSLAPTFIKDLRRLPVGNFIAFPYEIYRTGINTIGRALDEMASTNAEIQKIGLRRMTGATGTFAALPAATASLAYEASGVSEDEMKAFQRSFAAPYEKNAVLLPTGRTADGLPKYVNFSYSNPYDQLARVARGALNMADTQRELGKSGAEIATMAGIEGLKETFLPFFGTSIITDKALDITVRGGRTSLGAFVFQPGDDAGTKVAKSFTHFADGLLPNFIPVQVRGGRFEAARFARGVFGTPEGNELFFGVQSKDNQKNERDLSEEVARAITGLTEREPNIDNLFRYKAADFQRGVRNAPALFTTVASRPTSTADEIFEAYVAADESKYRVHNQMFQTIEDLRTLGFDDFEIDERFSNQGLGATFREVQAGEYSPYRISRAAEERAIQAGNEGKLDFDRFDSYYDSRAGIPFAADNIEEVEPDLIPELPLTSPEAPAAAPQPTATAPQASLQTPQTTQIPQITADTRFFMPGTQQGVFSQSRGIPFSVIQESAQARGTTPEQLIQTTGLQRVDAELLGSNPIEQARNLELVQRTRRGV